MKNFKMLRIVMIVALVAFLSVGCAKKATEEMATEAPSSSSSQSTDTGMKETAVVESDAKETTMATVSDLTRIHFDFDSYVLSGEARATLKQNAMILKASSMLKVKIEGHCDERGSDDYNLALGEQRAQATMDYMRSLGVSGSQMATVSMGEMAPLDPASNEAAWSKNRRSEFVAM